ncbi:MAG: galactokinase [Bacteroidetes bacterium GWF2_40_14]|nr:MAG: galactokinase [Bacteroidetes bacterium GWF2_40_14]
MIDKLNIIFNERFSCNPEDSYSSPGRINIIGEHTDYNLGFVLPAAIDRYITGSFKKNNVGLIRVFSADFNEYCEFKITDRVAPEMLWSKFVYGVAQEIVKKIADPRITTGIAFDCVFGGDIPLGAGLSSSAALENLFSFAINDLYRLNLSKEDLILIGQATEHNYIGVNCGIMDQFASMMGREGSVLKLDCRSLDFSYLLFDNDKVRIVLFDTKVKHSLASSEYNIRRLECEKSVSILKEFFPVISSLRDLSMDQIEQYKDSLPDILYRRCSYVAEENARLLMVCDALGNSDYITFGKLICQSHKGLRYKYQVSCEELDFLADAAENFDGCYGARMMGGGFGGCTICFVRPDVEEVFTKELSESFYNKYGTLPDCIDVNIGKGTHKISQQP